MSLCEEEEEEEEEACRVNVSSDFTPCHYSQQCVKTLEPKRQAIFMLLLRFRIIMVLIN